MPTRLTREISPEQREELTSLLLRNVTDYAIILLDPTGHVATWDEGAQRLLGYAAEEILGQHVSVFFTREQVAQGQPDGEIERARTTGQCEDENWLVRRDGSRLWATGSTTALWSDTGTLRGFAKIIRDKDGSWCWVEATATNLLGDPAVQAVVINVHDVTERKQAAERLVDSEERFRLLVQHSSDIITVLTPEGTVLYSSPSLEHVLGYAPAERVGTNIFLTALVHPEDVEAKKAMLRQAVEHPAELVRAEFRLRHKDGRWRWIEAVARNLLHDPRIGGIIANYRDVTERKQAAERLAHSEERFRLLVQHSSDLITIINSD